MNALLERRGPDTASWLVDPHGFNELKRCRTGLMLYNKHDVFIGRSLQKYGEFSIFEVEAFRAVIRPEMTVIDAGANIGAHTLELSMMADFVVAFEPQRIAFQTLCANMALNNRTNVRAFHAALGAKNGTITVQVLDQTKPANFGGVVIEDATDGEAVELMTLDRFEFNNLGFVKADLEGMEFAMLQGAEKTIAKHRPILYVETNGLRSAETRQWLLDAKYDLYWHCPPMFNKDNFFGDAENIFENECHSQIASTNMLCFPSETKAIVPALRAVKSLTQTWNEELGFA